MNVTVVGFEVSEIHRTICKFPPVPFHFHFSPSFKYSKNDSTDMYVWDDELVIEVIKLSSKALCAAWSLGSFKIASDICAICRLFFRV